MLPVMTQVIVAAAVLDGGRLLAAQRAYPPALAGLWELPGGKVEPEERDEVALHRECREELGIDVHLDDRLGGDWPIGAHGVLRVWTARLATGTPTAHEHAALRWLEPDELFNVDWLPGDVPVIEALQELLKNKPRS